jgi:hypothetical protein
MSLLRLFEDAVLAPFSSSRKLRAKEVGAVVRDAETTVVQAA